MNTQREEKENPAVRFFRVRSLIVGVLLDEGIDDWAEVVKITTSAINEYIVPYGHQAIVTLRPLLTYHEADERI